MGLLDIFGDNPEANIAMAGGLLQGRSRLSGLLNGLSAYGASTRQQEQLKQAKAMAERKMAIEEALKNAQVGEYQAQAQERLAKIAQAKQNAEAAAALRARQQSFFGGQSAPAAMAGAGGPSIMAGSGERTPAQNAAVANAAQQPTRFDFATAVQLFGPEQATKIMKGMDESRNFGIDEVARLVDTVGADNRPIQRREDSRGRTIGGDILKPFEAKLINQGDRMTAVDQYNIQPGQAFSINQDANSKASNATTMRGQNMADARSRDANNIASQGNIIKTESELRKEFADLPEVKTYKSALPSYNAVVDASKRMNPQADINLIYGLAKLYDPTSVVREGEYATIANSQAIPEWLKSQAQRLAGGGRLTAETKAQIVVEANSRIGSYQNEYEGAKGAFEKIAAGRGAEAKNVFTPVGAGAALPKRIQSDADYTELPSGTIYIAPDGTTRRKP